MNILTASGLALSTVTFIALLLALAVGRRPLRAVIAAMAVANGALALGAWQHGDATGWLNLAVCVGGAAHLVRLHRVLGGDR